MVVFGYRDCDDGLNRQERQGAKQGITLAHSLGVLCALASARALSRATVLHFWLKADSYELQLREWPDYSRLVYRLLVSFWTPCQERRGPETRAERGVVVCQRLLAKNEIDFRLRAPERKSL